MFFEEARQDNIKRGPTSRDELLQAAREQNWELFDTKLADHLTAEDVQWALSEGMFDDNEHVRDAAMNILDESDIPLNEDDKVLIETHLLHDDSDIVRYRAAIALSKWDFRSPEIDAVMLEAIEDPSVGELAERYFKPVTSET